MKTPDPLSLPLPIHTHQWPIPALRAELREMRLRVKLDKGDRYAKERAKAVAFYLADRLFFARLYALKAAGKDTGSDRQLAALSARLDKALAAVR